MQYKRLPTSVRLSQELQQKLRKAAMRDHRSVSKIIELCVEKTLINLEEGDRPVILSECSNFYSTLAQRKNGKKLAHLSKNKSI